MAWGEGACLLAQSLGLSAGVVLPLQIYELVGLCQAVSPWWYTQQSCCGRAAWLSGPAAAVTVSWTNWRGSCLSRAETN